MKPRTRTMLASILSLALRLPVSAQADFKGLPEAASDEAKKWAVVFDFDTDSCYPAPAVSSEGRMNGGLKDSGDITGECRDIEQFKNANTYCRTASLEKDGTKYAVYLYALYFEKDQAVSNTHFGHRHDWEYALVWTRNGELTHASFSSHGGLGTIAKANLNFDADKPDHVKVVYHKDGIATHCFRPAKQNEPPENALNQWVTPTLVEWDRMKSDAVSNEVLRLKFNHHNFGEANCPFNDDRFANEIAKSPPPDFPSSDEWRSAAASQPRTRDYTKEPPTPSGLVARWQVFRDRVDTRDDRHVSLAKGRTAKLVVHLPEGPRERFRFNLKHNKPGRTDRGRTARIGHGDTVSGDAHDWPAFGKRIYLGERDGSDQSGFDVSSNGFYVDLVLVR